MTMAHAVKKVTGDASAKSELGFDIASARLVRRGPTRSVRFSLRALRESAGKTQAQVAKASGLAQPDVSKLETATTLDDRQLSTLRRYLAALGDELELVAVSKIGHRIGINGAESARLDPALAPVTDPIQVAIGAALRLAQGRANETHAQRDIDVALILEAVRHMLRSGGKRGARIANAASKYLDGVRSEERVWYDQPVEMKSAAKWTNDLRVHMVEAIEGVSRLRREEAGGVDIAAKLDWWTNEIMRSISVVAPVRHGDRTRVRSALAGETDAEALLRKVLEAYGLSSGDVNRLTKAEYVKGRRRNAARRKRAAK